MNGRWESGEYIWSCEGCGCVLCSSQAPSAELAKCLGCRVNDELGRASRLIRDLVKDRDEWMVRARKAERENGDLLDELDDMRRKRGAA